MPFANDGVLSYELICERINSDLANVLGNLVNRTIAMTKKYFGGIVPAPTAPEALDDELKAVALGLPAAVEKKMDTLHVADAIDEVFALLRRSNKYIDETMPWALAKDESKQARLGTVLYNLLEAIRFAAVELKPYLPDTADKIFAQLGVENKGVESLTSFDGMQPGQPGSAKPPSCLSASTFRRSSLRSRRKRRLPRQSRSLQLSSCRISRLTISARSI